MYVQLNCVIVDSDVANRGEMAAFLSQYGVTVSGQFASADSLAALLGRSDAPQLVILNLDPNPQETLKKLGHLPRQFPTVSFFAMSQVLDAQLLMETMHMGVKEFIPLPVQEEKFAAAIERMTQQYGMAKRAKIIHVIPSVGGSGSTTVACNVAASLAASGKAPENVRTALLDLDLVRGGVAGYFDLRPKYTIADVMESAEKVDRQLIDNAMAVHGSSRVAVLARPELPEETQRVTPAGMKRLLGVLGRSFDYIVVDSVMSVDPLYSATIAAADVNVIVMQLNIPSAKNAERFVGALRRMGIESSKIRIVVNRYVKKGCDIEPAEVERALGLRISWMVPNDFKNAINAINFGEPVVLRAPRSEMSRSLGGLAGELHNKAA
jgi:pilus assembly protein CpaE